MESNSFLGATYIHAVVHRTTKDIIEAYESPDDAWAAVEEAWGREEYTVQRIQLWQRYTIPSPNGA